ncbi:MAG TPA: hypothetical protein VM843_02570 [Flavisolibacter sp.]|nr:hypothetical protein [Flavisolibacter sp.]
MFSSIPDGIHLHPGIIYALEEVPVAIGTVFKTQHENNVMDASKDSGEKRKRKIIVRPVLIRSVKPGQVPSATYTKENTAAFAPIWKS